MIMHHPLRTNGGFRMKEYLSEQKKRCRENGFSLIEVMIATAILSIGLLSVGVMQSTALKGTAVSQSVSDAANMASEKMEQLRVLPKDHYLVSDRDLDGSAGLGDVGVGTSDHSETVRLRERNYQIFWNVADRVIDNSTRTVAVIVQWKEGTDRHVIVQGVLPINQF
jgi:prepilin-type N-terminal cleavage/methylation domain-containing protein